MSFVKFANDGGGSTHTQVDNVFIAEYLPYAPDICVKIYLYGLYLCGNPDSPENDMDRIASALNILPEDVINLYGYWQELGLVHIIKQEPPGVRYLPVRSGGAVSKYSSGGCCGF